MKKCPNCNHKLYKGNGGVSYCKHCGYKNDPDYKKEKNGKN